MKSVDFKTSLFPIKVKQKKDKKTMSYYDYLKYEWRVPWWEDCFGLRAPKPRKDTLVNTFELTPEQARRRMAQYRQMEQMYQQQFGEDEADEADSDAGKTGFKLA